MCFIQGVTIKYDANGKTFFPDVKIRRGDTYFDLLEHIGQNEETVLIFHNDRPVPFDECVVPGIIRILKTTFDGQPLTILQKNTIKNEKKILKNEKKNQ